jgi:hypothetical protein
MNTAVTTIYTITEDWLKSRRHQQSAQRTAGDAEVMTVAITTARFFEGHSFEENYAKAWRHLTEGRYMLLCRSESRFNRLLRRIHHLDSPSGFTIWIHHLFEALFDRLAACWKDLSDENVFSIDSFPVPVCDNIRINDCRINDCRINDCRIYPSDATEDAFRDYIASKRRFFYGLKVHVMTDAEGRPVEASLKPGSLGDTGQLRGFEFDLPEEAIAHGDKAYGRVFHRRHAG